MAKETRPQNAAEHRHLSAFSTRRDRQEPDQHAEQQQGPEHGERGVQGVKLEIRIAREAMPDGEHKTLLFARAARPEKAFRLYSPTSRCGIPVACGVWYTIAMPEKIAVITGTSSGIGLLTSVELAKAGFRVIATMRDLGRRARLDMAVSATGVGVNVEVRELDVTKFETMPVFVESVLRDFGRIDVLVNNAGFPVAGFAEDIRLEELRQQFETNFFGAVALTKAVLPTMRKQRSGHIIQVSSIVGLNGAVTVSSYSASKHALEGWSESLRLEVKPLGIEVVLVEPGAFQTDIWTRSAVMGKEATKPTSPNLQRSLKVRERITKIPKHDPVIVARAIAAIAQDPHPRLRYLVGRDAKLQLAMKRILPWKWYEKMVANYLKID